MSVFRQLTMKRFHSAVNYMYATIKGSLTESPSGVFSGFSNNGNYLQVNKTISLGSNFEIVIKVKTGTLVNTDNSIISGLTNQYISIGYNRASGSYKFQYNVGNGSGWITTNPFGDTVISSDTEYLIKFTFNGNTYTAYLSTDNGENWVVDKTLNSSQIIPNFTLNIGVGRALTTCWQGSIDLNQSYIKINNTKYHLQAVVGYTIVGSPTIVDGVVSGFSNVSGSYAGLQISNYNSSKAFEWVVKFQYQAPTNCVIFGRGNGLQSLLIANNGLRVVFNSSNRIQLNNTWTADQWYIAKLTYDGTSNYTLSLYSNDNLIDSKSLSYAGASSFTTFCIGSAFSSSAGDTFNGSIDLTETYIKINNKLWFNGQPA